MVNIKLTATECKNIIKTKGIGYAVMQHCRGSSIADGHLAELWDNAARCLFALEDYINDKADEESRHVGKKR